MTGRFEPYNGHHCESTAMINMLRSRDIDLSEPLIFGLGQGLSFLYWDSKQMPFPFLGGRVKPDHLIVNASAALGLDLVRQETASKAKAEATLLAALDAGDVVGLKLDRYHLDFCRDEHHFAAHYLACIGYEGDKFIVAETQPLAVETTSRQSMAEARAARGPMSSRSLSVRLGSHGFDPSGLGDACTESIRATVDEFLNPPIKNMGYTGITKAGTLMRRWYEQIDRPDHALVAIGRSIEDNGTGGGFFRSLWAAFLEEAAAITGTSGYEPIAARYHQISKRWTEVSNLLKQADPAALLDAAAIVDELAVDERQAMEALREVAV